MTNQDHSEPAEVPDRTSIRRAILPGPSLLRQFGNGVGGLVVLLLSGLILIIVVVLKSR